MSVESAHTSGNGRTDEIFARVQIDQLLGVGLQPLLQHRGLDDGLADHRFAATVQPVDGGRFLVGAVVAAQTHHFHVGEVALDGGQRRLRSLSEKKKIQIH